MVSVLVSNLVDKFGKSYPWAIGKGRQLPSGYILAKKKKHYESGRPIISFVDSPFRPMLNILARMIFQLIPVACPQHFATGDVYHLLSILRQAPEHGDFKLYNQDLAGFFTSIDQKRFFGAICFWTFFAHIWMSAARSVHCLSRTKQQSRRPHQGTNISTFECHKENHHQGRPGATDHCLNMQAPRLGQWCVHQLRGSPMGSPLSSA